MASIQGFSTHLGVASAQAPGTRVSPALDGPRMEETPTPVGDQLQVNFKSPTVAQPTTQPAAPDSPVPEPSPPPAPEAPATQSNTITALGGDFFLTGTGGLAQIDPTPQTLIAGPPGGGPASERQVSESELREAGVSGEFVSDNNIRFMHTGSSLFYHAQGLFEGKSVKLATTGFGEGPAGYAETTQSFMSQLGEALKGDLALVARPGSGDLSDALTSVAQTQNLPILYLTDDASLGLSCQPGPSVDAEKLKSAPKFSMSDQDNLRSMTGVLTNRLLITGGDKSVIQDFIRSIDHGNPVVLLTNSQNPGPAFDEASGRLLKAPEFLAGMLTTGHESLGLSSGPYGTPQDPVVYTVGRWLDMESPKSPAELVKTPDNPNGLVLILDAQDPEAAQKAAAHLRT